MGQKLILLRNNVRVNLLTGVVGGIPTEDGYGSAPSPQASGSIPKDADTLGGHLCMPSRVGTGKQ